MGKIFSNWMVQYVSEDAAYFELKQELKNVFTDLLKKYKLYSDFEFVYCSIRYDENQAIRKDQISIFLQHKELNVKVYLPKDILEMGGICAARDYISGKVDAILNAKAKEATFTNCDSSIPKQLMKEIIAKDLQDPFWADRAPDGGIYGATEQAKKNTKNNKKEKNMSKKLYDVEYENEIAAINEKAKSEKKALDVKAEEALAKAEEAREKAKIKEQANTWASGVHAMFTALVEQGFSEDIALELIKIQIANNK